MSEAAFVNDARVMAKGQVTIPKNVRAALDISDEAVARRRLELTSLIKALETTRDWTARAALIQGEMDRMSKEPEEIA